MKGLFIAATLFCGVLALLTGRAEALGAEMMAAGDAAVELGRRQALAEPGIIAPQFYHGRMQFLMPLYLSGKSKADLAMALSIGDGYYIGETCLTPQMAYLNARLLARPTAGWLREQT